MNCDRWFMNKTYLKDANAFQTLFLSKDMPQPEVQR